MGSLSIKEECNRKYARLLELLRGEFDLKRIHDEIIDVAETLVEVGKFSPVDRRKCNEKATFLISVAKKITADTTTDDIYLSLTGSHLPGHSRSDELRRELDGLKKSDKTASGKIAGASEIPARKGESGGIRPVRLDDYIGQDRVKRQISEAIAAAKIKGSPLEHVLLFGSAGLGKTSLAKIVASEMGSRIIIMSGPTIKDAASLVSEIKNIGRGDILFIDEIHRINPAAAESIYTAMEDFEFTYIEKDKEGMRNVTLRLPPFTVIGATTHSGLLEKPMRDRFPIQLKMEPYGKNDLMKIAAVSMEKLGKHLDDKAAAAIAVRSRGVPRNCNSFVQLIYNRALVRCVDCIDVNLVEDFFTENGIDENGLTDIDLAYLKTVYEKFGNRPVGIDNIASCLGEGKNIIESQIEPYLLYSGLIQITPSGRMLTPKGEEYIGKM